MHDYIYFQQMEKKKVNHTPQNYRTKPILCFYIKIYITAYLFFVQILMPVFLIKHRTGITWRDERNRKMYNLLFPIADITIIMKKASKPSFKTRLKIHTLYYSAGFQPHKNWQQCKWKFMDSRLLLQCNLL